MPADQKELNPAPANFAERVRTAESGSPSPENASSFERPGLENGSPAEVRRPEISGVPAHEPAGAKAAARVQPADESYIKYKQIEKVLEEDLGEIYNNLTPQEQKTFKMKGEEAARSIFQLIYHQTKIRVKKIVRLIKDWLKAVPGINRFFLEQEAKIKADKIVALADGSKKIEF